MPRLENWIPIQYLGKFCLFGEIYDDPRYNKNTSEFENGHHVVTSPLEGNWLRSISPPIVKTQSGNLYELGKQGSVDELKHPILVLNKATWDSESFQKEIDEYLEI